MESVLLHLHGAREALKATELHTSLHTSKCLQEALALCKEISETLGKDTEPISVTLMSLPSELVAFVISLLPDAEDIYSLERSARFFKLKPPPRPVSVVEQVCLHCLTCQHMSDPSS